MSGAVPEPDIEADFALPGPFPLEAGGALPSVTLRYTVYGPAHLPAVLVCHALSGSARVADWWGELVGPGLPFDLARNRIIGVNILGSCYGSTGPTSLDPRTQRPYGKAFPLVTIGDMVESQRHLLDHLGIDHLEAVVGGSIGGMQALAWAWRSPERVGRCVAVGACPLNALGLALTHLQRQAILNDADDPPRRGLALARSLAMLTYKSTGLLAERYGRRPNRTGEDPYRDPCHRFDVGGYLDYQGRSFCDRFDAACYLTITRAMETFDLGRTADAERQMFARLTMPVRLIGIGTDWLFPPEDVRALAERMNTAGADAIYTELTSTHGHDGFLADCGMLRPLLHAALA